MTAYRDEHGRFRKRNEEDAKREYEAMSPFMRNMYDAMAHAGRLQTRAILDSYADRQFFEGSQFAKRPDEQGDMRSLYMHRVYDQSAAPPRPAWDYMTATISPQSQINANPSIGIRKGDVFTISARAPWWRRVLIWLRIIKPEVDQDEIQIERLSPDTPYVHRDER